jgi:hypothetical protein
MLFVLDGLQILPNMTWTKDLIRNLDLFNMSSNLNATNEHLVNMTKKVQSDLVSMKLLPNITLPEMQHVLQHLDIFNITKLDIFNVTKLDIFNVTKLDIFNGTNLDIFNVTKLDIFNVTKLDIFNVTRFDLFNMTSFDILNATFHKVEQTLKEGALTKNASSNAASALKDKSDLDDQLTELNLVSDPEEATTPEPNFLMERIKELQSFQSGIGSSIKNLLSPPTEYIKNPPVKMKDLQGSIL